MVFFLNFILCSFFLSTSPTQAFQRTARLSGADAARHVGQGDSAQGAGDGQGAGVPAIFLVRSRALSWCSLSWMLFCCGCCGPFLGTSRHVTPKHLEALSRLMPPYQ